MAQVVHSLALFVLAGLCEIGGRYLIWQWWRNGANWGVGAVGALVLFLYGIVQPISRRASAGSMPPMEEFCRTFNYLGMRCGRIAPEWA